jgi:hypothetical protein
LNFGYINITSEDELKLFAEKIIKTMKNFEDFNKISKDEIKSKLNMYPCMLHREENCIDHVDIKYKMSVIGGIIWGDYKYKNEDVDVFLHQRTNKKIKYKKREYSRIHPISKTLLIEIQPEISKIIQNNKEKAILFSIENKEIQHLKREFNKIL